MTRSVPALLLTLVYAAALVVAVSDPGRHVLAGLLVLGGLTARGALHHRRAAAPATAVPLTAQSDWTRARDVLPSSRRRGSRREGL